MTTNHTLSALSQGNIALRKKDYITAITHYLRALQQAPALGNTISSNFYLIRSQYPKHRSTAAKPAVAICSWELAHNPAGRAYTLAKLYQSWADVEIIGSIFPSHGKDIWEPIRNTTIPKHTFLVKEESHFIDQAITLVSSHPYDIVHLSKPRAPNLFFGLLYKLIWGSKVLIDIDDEELAFVGTNTAISIDDYIKTHSSLPELKNLAGKEWTQIAVGMVNKFDGVTVSNPALQKIYGGEIIRHARDENLYSSSPDKKIKNRETLGITSDKKVVLFLGTPREHKGLIDTAYAIQKLQRKDILFTIIGEFPNSELKAQLKKIPGVNYLFLENQPIEKAHEYASIGDVCILLQDPSSHAAKFQTPAKLTDMLASGVVVLASDICELSNLSKSGAVISVTRENLPFKLDAVLRDNNLISTTQKIGRETFLSQFSCSAITPILKKFSLGTPNNSETKLSSDLEIALFLNQTKLEFLKPVKVRSELTHSPQVSPQRTSPPVSSTKPVKSQPKLPITVLVVTWDVGHNPLGRSYMLAEALDRVARNVVLVGFQFPRYGNDIWEPVRNGRLPVISLPGKNLPELYDSIDTIAERIKPDIVIACKPRLPSMLLGLKLKARWGCPFIVDVDDHELSFFKNQKPLEVDELAAMQASGNSEISEPYSELWTRLSHTLCKHADDILVSNVALHREFGGNIIPHVRDETVFDPVLYEKSVSRARYGIPQSAKVILFFGTPRLHKGIDTLAQAVGQIPDENYRLVVVGSAPDRSVTAKLETMAPGKIIYLPNQPFGDIPNILAMTDIVCLPQDESHPISQFQLPAKAIDAVGMGIPLLVTRTPPLMQLVNDGVAIPIDKDNIVNEFQSWLSNPSKIENWRIQARSAFLARYSYNAAGQQLREILQRALSRRSTTDVKPVLSNLLTSTRRLLDIPAQIPSNPSKTGSTIILFWKQNDTGLYGRRHDMVIKYLASRPDVKRILVFDTPISEFDLVKRRENNSGPNQDRWIYQGTYGKLLGVSDTPKISYNVFAYPPGKYRSTDDGSNKPHINGAFIEYLEQVFKRESVDPEKSVFWVYPKNISAPELIRHFKPVKVVVDVVDDHRAWPGISDTEKARLTENYREILSYADMAFANCEPVQRSMQEFFPAIRLVPNGCDSEPVCEEPKNSMDYKEFCSWPGKTIGFIGNLEAKIDISLIVKIAERFSDCQITLLGSTHANPRVLELKKFPNIKMPGVIPYNQTAAWISRFDIGIIPHLDTEMTRSMNPLKLYVYLTQHIPVISTEINNVDSSSSFVHIAKNHDQFLSHIENILQNGKPNDTKDLQRYIIKNNWETRLRPHINELLPPCSSHKDMKIEKTIHLIWLPPSLQNQEIPNDVKKNISAWKSLHPTYNVKIWGYKEIKEELSFINKIPVWDAINSCNFEAMKSDIARLAIIYKHGGFYTDLKNLPLRSFLDTLSQQENAIITEHPPTVPNYQNLIINSFLGAPAGHPFFLKSLEIAVMNVINRTTEGGITNITGTGALLRAKSRLSNSGVLIIPSHEAWGLKNEPNGWMKRTSLSYNGSNFNKHWSIRQNSESLYK